MTLTITVTVGRNINGAPMSADHWEALQRRVRTVLAYATTGTGRLESHYGVGDWSGVTEDSAKITRYGTAWGQERGAEWLRAEIGDLARVYRQEAIALVIGEGELIGPDPLPPVRHAEPATLPRSFRLDRENARLRKILARRVPFDVAPEWNGPGWQR